MAAVINDTGVVCHREGGLGPMKLTIHEHVQHWAPPIRMRVANRAMAPYPYGDGIGVQKIQLEWRLSPKEPAQKRILRTPFLV